MRCIELDGKCITEVDVQFMQLDEITELMDRVQSEVFRLAKQKKQIGTLPKSKKDGSTLKKLTNISSSLIEFQSALTWLGKYKKQKRDTMAKEKEYFKEFYLLAKKSLPKRKFDKLVEQVTTIKGYSINI